MQPDGKIVVAGVKVGGVMDIVLARYLPNGTLDATFGDNGVVNLNNADGNDVFTASPGIGGRPGRDL